MTYPVGFLIGNWKFIPAKICQRDARAPSCQTVYCGSMKAFMVTPFSSGITLPKPTVMY